MAALTEQSAFSRRFNVRTDESWWSIDQNVFEFDQLLEITVYAGMRPAAELAYLSTREGYACTPWGMIGILFL